MPVKVDGLNRAVRDLQAVGVEVQDLKEVFTGIAREAAALASKYAPTRTGRLAKSVRGNKAKNKAVVVAGNARRVPYAGPINYGWRKRGIRPSEFMQRASNDMEQRAARLLEQGLDDVLRKNGLT